MLNKTPFVIRLGTSTEQVLLKTGMGWQSEIIHATDTGRVWLCSATEGPFQPLQTLDMAVCNNGDVVTHEDEIVWQH